MPDSLTNAFTAVIPGPDSSQFLVLVRLVLALVLGAGVAFVYRRTRRPSDITASFPTTLILLSVLIAMVTQVIGDNVARAFSLVGALSIVRFRTVVRDTQDTAYVIFAVAVGMAVGAHDLWVAGAGMAVVGLGAWLTRPQGPAPILNGDVVPLPYSLKVRLGIGQDAKALMGPVIETHLSACRLSSMATVKQGLAIDATYDVDLVSNGSADALVNALNRLEGVQGVELVRRNVEES